MNTGVSPIETEVAIYEITLEPFFFKFRSLKNLLKNATSSTVTNQGVMDVVIESH